MALLALQLVDAGVVALDDPIATVWPEFAAAGKEGATFRHALCHRAGVPAIREPLTNDDLWDWDRMAGALAATAPWWEPGTRHAYHTNTYGHLIGEVVRRVSGEPCGRRLAALGGPAGADVHVGVPPAEQASLRRGALRGAAGPPAALDDALEGDARMEMLSYFNPPGYSSMGVVNTAAWRAPRCRRPTGTARRTAWRACTPRCSSPAASSRPTCWPRRRRPQSEGYCPILHEDGDVRAGVQTHGAARPFGPNPGASATSAPGGRWGSLIPVGGVAFGYVMNHVIPRWQSTRNRSLIDALYRSF